MTRKAGRKLTNIGLFAGIGGLELGLHRAGHSTVSLCEIDPAAISVLTERFREAHLSQDVREVDRIPAGVDLLSAGFPCQDLSQAGRTAGIRGARSGLVSHVFRLLEDRAIPSVLLENVPFMLRLGRGSAMSYVVDEFERLGYRWAYRVVDARSFGLPQRRQRVYFLAMRHEDPRRVLFADDASTEVVDGDERSNGVACGFYWTEGTRGLGWAVNSVPTLKGGSSVGVPSPPAIWMPDGRIVTPSLRDAERLQGFPVDWTEPAERVVRASMRWKLIGNAVSVPVASWLGRRLAAPGTAAVAGSLRLRAKSPWPNAAFNVGEGRFSVDVSMWPVSAEQLSLAEFVRWPRPLSIRAASGFLARARNSSLRFPPGFLRAIERHIEQGGLARAS
ncbi:MAG: DNA (cytosine-5-)-methyltransferase [Planctomycetes bacterium]|nr:DNA (cytosine-5-)-methyltransferase [Planctomycetota bacterium]MCC7169822.1 DNA (cytosine-5-)-methyltransferase [Planctomycetota bacterium]